MRYDRNLALGGERSRDPFPDESATISVDDDERSQCVAGKGGLISHVNGVGRVKSG